MRLHCHRSCPHYIRSLQGVRTKIRVSLHCSAIVLDKFMMEMTVVVVVVLQNGAINPHLCVTVSIVACAKCTFSMLCSGVTWHRCTVRWHESKECRHSTKATEMSLHSCNKWNQKQTCSKKGGWHPRKKYSNHIQPLYQIESPRLISSMEHVERTWTEACLENSMEPGKKEQSGAVLSTILVSNWIITWDKSKRWNPSKRSKQKSTSHNIQR